MNSRSRTSIALLGGSCLLAVAAGCGDSNESSADATPSKPTTTLAAPDTPDTSPSPTTAEPNVGDRALRVGQTRHGTYVNTTLAEIRFPYPPAQYRDPETPGDKFLGLRLRQCLSKNFDPADFDNQQEMSTFNGEFAAVAPDGNQAAGNGSSFNDWPRPKFPELVSLNPGDCVKGWIALEIPGDMKIKKVVFRPDDQTVAEWLP